MLKVNNLTKLYGSQAAVDNLSFEAKKGEILGFLGPNGAGKSTTMKIATCYMAASSGNVEVCGIDVTENPKKVRSKIGYLPEHNPLYLDMYVKEYLAFMGKFYDTKGSVLKTRISEVIELVKLERESHKQLRQLSKGYRQRVGLAQALLHNPEVLILDEPTTGLDPNQIVEIRQVIKSISAEKTIIFSTHIMQEVQALCDKVVIINRGEKVLDTSIANLNAQLNNDLKTKLNQNQYILNLQTENLVLEENWRQIEGVVKVEINQSEPTKVKLFTQNDLRKEIFLYSAQNNWILLEMQQQTQSLENVFHQLTK